MINNWRDWLAAIAFIVAFGSAGSDDYDYRCDQARKANKNETNPTSNQLDLFTLRTGQ